MERKWVVTDQVHSCQLQQKCESALGPDLALMVRRGAHGLAFMLECEAHRFALKLKREATQVCVLMLKCDPEVRVLKSSTTIAFDTERDRRAVLLMKYDVRV